MEKEFNLSEKRKKMFEAVKGLAPEKHKDTINVIKINIEVQDEEFIKLLKGEFVIGKFTSTFIKSKIDKLAGIE